MSNFGILITIILVVGWVIKGISSAMGNEDEGGKQRPKRSLEEWDELQAQRREAMSEQQQALSEMRSDTTSQNPAQMTMAERIELARQRARQQAGVPDQGGQQQAEVLRQARARAEQQAKQQRELAQRQQFAREQAEQQRNQRERERIKQQRRRQAEQEAQAQRQQRAKQNRRTQSTGSKPAVTGSKREGVIADSMQRIHLGHEHGAPKVTRRVAKSGAGLSVAGLGVLDRKALRKAFVMKELLDKPVALRDPQADLLS